jgi:hypothetical protein
MAIRLILIRLTEPSNLQRDSRSLPSIFPEVYWHVNCRSQFHYLDLRPSPGRSDIHYLTWQANWPFLAIGHLEIVVGNPHRKQTGLFKAPNTLVVTCDGSPANMPAQAGTRSRRYCIFNRLSCNYKGESCVIFEQEECINEGYMIYRVHWVAGLTSTVHTVL